MTINSTLSHIYRDIYSGFTHCYNTTQWYRAAQVGVYGCSKVVQKTKRKTSPCLILFFLLSVEKRLTKRLDGNSSDVERKKWVVQNLSKNMQISAVPVQTKISKWEKSRRAKWCSKLANRKIWAFFFCYKWLEDCSICAWRFSLSCT